MSDLKKAVLWFFVGPVASFALGYALFLVFGFILGAGFDLDDQGSPARKFFGGLAIPALALVAGGGTLISIGMSIRCFLHDRRPAPKSTESSAGSDRQDGSRRG